MNSTTTSMTPHLYPTNTIVTHNSGQTPEKIRQTAEPINTQSQEEKITISNEGRRLSYINDKNDIQQPSSKSPASHSAEKDQNLDAEETRELQQLKQRDTEVRAHEQAHLSVAGQYASGSANFSYKTGPNGQKYAVGGEVPIDMSGESTPEETIIKMSTIKRAALAPASPSSADRRIAAQASINESQARMELQRSVNPESTTSESDHTATTSNDSNDAIKVQQNSRHMILKAYQTQLSTPFDLTPTS